MVAGHRIGTRLLDALGRHPGSELERGLCVLHQSRSAVAVVDRRIHEGVQWRAATGLQRQMRALLHNVMVRRMYTQALVAAFTSLAEQVASRDGRVPESLADESGRILSPSLPAKRGSLSLLIDRTAPDPMPVLDADPLELEEMDDLADPPWTGFTALEYPGAQVPCPFLFALIRPAMSVVGSVSR